MKNNIPKRLISILLTFTTVISMIVCFGVTVSAAATATVNAFDVPTASKYAMVYTIQKTGKTIPYTSNDMTCRGTITYRRSSTAYIANASDVLYLIDAGKNKSGKTWARVSYPISGSKRAEAYIPLSAISSASYGKNQLFYASSAGKFYCSLRKGGATSSSYYVSKGDPVYVFSVASTTGTNVQIMYPNAYGKWRIAYCTYSDARKYLDKVSSIVNPTNVSLSKTSVSLSGKGSTYSLSATVASSNATNKSVFWTTSNSSVATVNSSGKITAVSAGTANITCKTANGKTASCKVTVTIPSSKKTYSISNNILTVLGVKMSEYKIGSTFENVYYANVNGRRVYTGAKQCYGYACYIEQKLYGHCWHTASSHFPNLTGSVNVKPTSTSKLKKLITSAGVGAHIRTGANISGGKHSMIIIGITSEGFTVADANANNDNKVAVRTYTWGSYLSSNYGKQGFKFIEIHK